MRPGKYRSIGWRLIPLTGLIFFQGCFAALERDFDVLLSPSANENLGYLASGAVPWLSFLAKALVKVL